MAGTGESQAPVAAQVKKRRRAHGVGWNDPYDWLNDASARPVRQHVEVENAYANRYFAKIRATVKRYSIPSKNVNSGWSEPWSQLSGDWTYAAQINLATDATRFVRHPIHDQTHTEVLLDLKHRSNKSERDREANVAEFAVAPNHSLAAYTIDHNGSELHRIRVLNIDTSKRRRDSIVDAGPSIVWASDSDGFYYTAPNRKGPSRRVMFHHLGTKQADDVCVYNERRRGKIVDISRTSDGRFLLIEAGDVLFTDASIIDLHSADRKPKPLVDSADARCFRVAHDATAERFVFTDRTGANTGVFERPTLEVLAAAPGRPLPATLLTELPEPMTASGITVVGPEVVVLGSMNTRGTVAVVGSTGVTRLIEPPERFSEIAHAPTVDEDDGQFRMVPPTCEEPDPAGITVVSESMRMPRHTMALNVPESSWSVLPQQSQTPLLDPRRLLITQTWFASNDGELVPVTILARTDTAVEWPRPMVAFAYASYGTRSEHRYWGAGMQLVAEGAAVALIHSRGGSEKGLSWHDEGAAINKPKAIEDVAACLRGLSDQGWTTPQQLALSGASAGGIIAGAIANRYPALCGTVIASEPFLDVRASMLDRKRLFTTDSYPEFGDPRSDPAVFRAQTEYSPVEGARPQRYPRMYLHAGLSDRRVPPSDVLRYAAAVRHVAENPEDIVVRISAGGHLSGGTIGQQAEMLAFIANGIGLDPLSSERTQTPLADVRSPVALPWLGDVDGAEHDSSALAM